MRSRVWQVVVLATMVAAACSSGDGRELEPPDSAAAASASTMIMTSEPGSATSEPGSIDSPTTGSVSPGPGSIDSPTTGSVSPEPGSIDSPTTGSVPPAPAVEPVGFETRAATITSAAGEACEVCLWLAASSDQRRRGLMGVTDLGVGDGMVFSYTQPTTREFWMNDTPMPLTIAFFDADGAYMDAFDMTPCEVDPCRRYSTPRNFLNGIEFPQGTLAEFGVGPGSTLELSDLPCE